MTVKQITHQRPTPRPVAPAPSFWARLRARGVAYWATFWGAIKAKIQVWRRPTEVSFWRFKLAKKVTKALLGREMYFSPFKKGTLTATAVFWFDEAGKRKYLMVRPNKAEAPKVQTPAAAEHQQQAQAQFISCLDVHSSEPIYLTLQKTVTQVLGPAFAKSLGKTPFGPENVACAPAFSYRDARSQQEMPVQNLTWVQQISKAQAELSVASVGGIEVVAVPEGAMNTNLVLEPHKLIFQTVTRRLHDRPTQALPGERAILDELEQHLRQLYGQSKTLH